MTDRRVTPSQDRDPGAIAWRMSSFSSSQGGQCVEVARRAAAYLIRDSKDREGPVLVLNADQWRDFRSGIAAGDFDLI